MSSTQWNAAWRSKTWNALDQPWDLVVIGGGITGAGVFREATRAGLRVLLLEQRDFASGTSSRSSKLIHGGLRYLKQGKIGLVRDSVRERDELLRSAPGLVQPLPFLYASYRGDKPGPRLVGAGLTVYDYISGQQPHERHDKDELLRLAPLTPEGLLWGYIYRDAQTDDARLVLRLLREGSTDGGVALNYAAVEKVLFDGDRARGVRLRDLETGRVAEVRAAAVVNATGAWAAALRPAARKPERLRPLRGSHLVFPGDRLPVRHAVTFLHPDDRRPVFAIPWEGATLLGTTDLDHREGLSDEPHISEAEVTYLMRAVQLRFAGLGLTEDDVVATFAGVRPVIDTGAADPSSESREHGVWDDGGLITVTGGKLTTYRLMALEVLERVHQHAPMVNPPSRSAPMFATPEDTLPEALPPEVRARLLGRYGADAGKLALAARRGDWARVGQTDTLWAELRWSARAEGVLSLDDLLLRRTRLGLLLPDGGLSPDLRERIATICREELGWNKARWRREAEAYEVLWRRSYGPPRVVLAAAEPGLKEAVP